MCCCKCGGKNKQANKFCGKCTEQKESVSNRYRPKTSDDFVSDKGKLRTARNLPKKNKFDSRNMLETKMFASLLKEDAESNLKQGKGIRPPIKVPVEVSGGYQRLKEAVFEKFARYNRKGLQGKGILHYKLVYKNGERIK